MASMLESRQCRADPVGPRSPMSPETASWLSTSHRSRGRDHMPGPMMFAAADGLDDPAAMRKKLCAAVDAIPELRDAGVILELTSSRYLLLRESKHASGLATFVLARVEQPTAIWQTPEQPGFWDRWGGVIVNCSAAALSVTLVKASTGATIMTAGVAMPLVILSASAAAASGGQCGLAVGKVSSSVIEDYLESEDGKWVNHLDVVLDVASLAGGVGGALKVVKGAGRLLKTGRVTVKLNETSKGQLLKTLDRMHKQEQDLGYLKDLFARAASLKGVASARGAEVMTNNALKRALPLITTQLKRERLSALGDTFAFILAVSSSATGGVGSKQLGTVKVTIELLQEQLGD